MSQETSKIREQVRQAPSVTDQAKAAKTRYDEAQAGDDFYRGRAASTSTATVDPTVNPSNGTRTRQY